MDGMRIIGQVSRPHDKSASSRRRRAGSWAVGAAVPALLGMLAAACDVGSLSNSSPTTASTVPSGPALTVLAAYKATNGAQSAHLSIQLGVTAPGQPAEQATGTGAASFVNQQMELSLAVPEIGTLHERLVGGTIYVMLPPQLAQQSGQGKPWKSLNLADLVPGASSSTLFGGSGSDPTEILGYLQGVSSSVTNLGPATVRGVQTTHYRAVVDLNKAAAEAGPLAADEKQLVSQLGTAHLPVDVWIDSQNRVNQEQLQLAIPSGPGGPGGPGTINIGVTMQLYDFGAPVTVTAPPPAQVEPLNLPTTASPR